MAYYYMGLFKPIYRVRTVRNPLSICDSGCCNNYAECLKTRITFTMRRRNNVKQ